MSLQNIIAEEIIKSISSNEENIQNENQSKKNKKEKKIFQKLSSKNDKKIMSLLKRPSELRKIKEQNISKTKIMWDDKNIEEHYLNRIHHPRNKIIEIKTSYPNGDEQDFYEKGINKVNETKLEELDLKEFKITDDNEDISDLLVNYDKFYDISKEEMKMCLQNTLINKFHKEFEKLKKGKIVIKL